VAHDMLWGEAAWYVSADIRCSGIGLKSL